MLFKLGFIQGSSEAVTDGRLFNGACQPIKPFACCACCVLLHSLHSFPARTAAGADATVNSMFAAADANGDGKVSYSASR